MVTVFSFEFSFHSVSLRTIDPLLILTLHKDTTMSFKKIFLATTLALTSSITLAGEVSYDYGQAGFLDYDGADGYSLELSTSFTENFYGRIDYSDLNADGFNGDASFTRLNLGYKTAISSSTDFIAELGYEDVDLDSGFTSGSDNGYNALVGFRGMATNDFELGGYLSYSDVLESTDLTVEGRYHFTPALSVAVEFGNDDELDEHYGVNLRFNF